VRSIWIVPFALCLFGLLHGIGMAQVRDASLDTLVSQLEEKDVARRRDAAYELVRRSDHSVTVIAALPIVWSFLLDYQKQRLQKANELLTSGRYNVKQTAAAVGYNNVSNFSSAYKKQFEKAPGAVMPVQ